ncbi:hypothetical protein EMIHUDRAFT_631901 [Emiliania huxleyi CCMP1516]|uniref:VPS9 domain-containing protein n=4 Tax=Emiliania huxleyi TaxID=2903 RepID=A0A0D3INF0_EMIH1|nr:hypothetical protein EMIHUDRAFT_631902 [Emiliania huxleyi CCMP1516]XP_005775893.1 hypothetical protein EMIHUDRAFT_631901 [Emiliania huxleyi CCMP1516]EOD12785.1 hypothetical protein EMIHUDRAFT_631902 [Emiliania huxleyi CCMP1516]EOD23464.1 hypothetical protein EMIHUDRAFT_631901 [Emiliania huxleyi CCMP1516]|eukprot:XP_005765214.1 hypothetical protein EMIHUDRAFT_631902 [Emiliania huxleyi CCMP1516]
MSSPLAEAEPLVRRALGFAESFEPAGGSADGEAVRALLASLEEEAAALWPAGWPAAALHEGLERYVMGLLLPKVFATGADAVEDKARVLSAQLDTLAFIGGAHVGIDESQAVGPDWEAALGELGGINSLAAPADKMGAVVRACARLSALVAPSDGSFVRLLALAILRARPARLHSNLEYVARFVDPHQLWSPEAGEPFTIARAAVQYLAHLDPAALSTPSHGRG